MPAKQLYQGSEMLTADEKALAYKLANVWQAPVFIYIDGERTVQFMTEKLGRREPQEAVFPSEKGKPRKLEDEPVLYKALESKATPQPVAVDDGSDLV